MRKKIDEWLGEGFTETMIIRTGLKIISPGTFKDMLTTKDISTGAELKHFLRAHLRDKISTEIFHDLRNAKHHKESPQQSSYRLMGLKQRVI